MRHRQLAVSLHRAWRKGLALAGRGRLGLGRLGLRPVICCAWHERHLGAVRVERPKLLYFNSFRYCQRIFKFNA
jgi:hypothetical protein